MEDQKPARRWLSAHTTGAWYIGTGAVAVVLYAIAAPLEAAVYGHHVLTALFATAAAYGSLVVAVRFPVIATIAFGLATLVPRAVYTSPEPAPWPWSATAIIAFCALVFTVWARHGWSRGLVAYLLPGLSVSTMTLIYLDGYTLANSIVALGTGAVSAALAALLRDRMRLGAQLTQERELSQAEQERRMVAEERQRIAREMHDVVAHGLSLIQVQATSAKYRIPDVPAPAAAEFDDIAASARTALAEMRRLLGALRGDDERAERAPQPTLADLPRLVAEARRAGADIELVGPPHDEMSAAASLAAYRIAQEAVSNAIRHAPGSRIDVTVRRDGGDLFVEVANTAAAAPTRQTDGAGHGIIGMRERAAQLGGSLSAGPTESGGYLVVAAIPLRTGERA